MSRYLTSFAGHLAHDSDHTVPGGSCCIQGTYADGREWRRVFRSTTTLFAAAKAEQAALAEINREERPYCSLIAYRVIGRGQDARAETIRI